MSFDVRRNRQFAADLIDLDDMLDQSVIWIQDNLDPEDVFDDSVLEEWATKNGFVYESDE